MTDKEYKEYHTFLNTTLFDVKEIFVSEKRWKQVHDLLYEYMKMGFEEERVRKHPLKYLKPHLVKTNYEEAVGKNVCVTEQIDNIRGTGTAVMNGLEWTARSVDDEKTFEPGMIVMVKEIKGVTLYVTESSDMPQMNGDK
jgi:hypothetical protein